MQSVLDLVTLVYDRAEVLNTAEVTAVTETPLKVLTEQDISPNPEPTTVTVPLREQPTK